MGGLGHVAVKLAHAMGAEVTVLSQTTSKRDDGLRYGADAYFATSDPDTFHHLANSFDLIINTVSAPVDLDAYLRLLRRNGTLVSVGAPPEPLPITVFNLFGGRRSFAGSFTGGLLETQEMLDFCAEHGIVPETELIDAAAINDAYERVLSSDVRYRFPSSTPIVSAPRKAARMSETARDAASGGRSPARSPSSPPFVIGHALVVDGGQTT